MTLNKTPSTLSVIYRRIGTTPPGRPTRESTPWRLSRRLWTFAIVETGVTAGIPTGSRRHADGLIRYLRHSLIAAGFIGKPSLVTGECYQHAIYRYHDIFNRNVEIIMLFQENSSGFVAPETPIYLAQSSRNHGFEGRVSHGES